MTLDPTAVITVDPAKNFGQPSIHGGPKAWVVADMIWAGDSVDRIAEDYEITRAAVLVACWFVAEYGTRAEKARWRNWKDAAAVGLWHGTYDLIPDPPSKEDTR